MPRGLAFVAGGSRGLGLLIARQLGARGYRLLVCAAPATNAELDRSLYGGVPIKIDAELGGGHNIGSTTRRPHQ